MVNSYQLLYPSHTCLYGMQVGPLLHCCTCEVVSNTAFLMCLQELLRERAEAAKQGVANLPQKAASAVGTVAEMAAGVVEHVGTKASETVSNIADSRNPRGTENTEESVMVRQLMGCAV